MSAVWIALNVFIAVSNAMLGRPYLAGFNAAVAAYVFVRFLEDRWSTK